MGTLTKEMPVKISNDNKKLIKLMVQKSQESFLLAIELFNKPTISLNAEGFVIFICNAWELLLKAHMLNCGKSIFYKKSGTKNRTLALDALIKNVMTNSKDNIRINLEIVNGIRNSATHLIIPEYTLLLNDVFLSCVKNYVDKLFLFFGISINEKLNTDFLNIHIPAVNKNKYDIKGKYGKQVYQKYYDTSRFLTERIKKCADENGVIPPTLALTYEIKFKRVNDITQADITMYNAKNEDSVKTVKVVETKDANITHPLKASVVIKEVNNRLKSTGITFSPYTLKKNTNFTMDSFGLFCRAKNIKTQIPYAYCHEFNNQYTYSYKLVEYIIGCIQDDPDLFIKIKEEIKKS